MGSSLHASELIQTVFVPSALNVTSVHIIHLQGSSSMQLFGATEGSPAIGVTGGDGIGTDVTMVGLPGVTIGAKGVDVVG
jgi:hypothetical protein